ncbi:MAG: hypothetical protein IJ466_08180 [Clostridia bacterium]|nr:hypothetical protein [Clostridia bacterium]
MFRIFGAEGTDELHFATSVKQLGGGLQDIFLFGGESAMLPDGLRNDGHAQCAGKQFLFKTQFLLPYPGKPAAIRFLPAQGCFSSGKSRTN